MEPLNRITVEVAFNSARRVEKGTKTDRPRLVPVHPTLAAILASWKVGGWARVNSRKPKPDGLIVPASRGGGHSTAQVTLELFHDALERLAMRHGLTPLIHFARPRRRRLEGHAAMGDARIRRRDEGAEVVPLRSVEARMEAGREGLGTK